MRCTRGQWVSLLGRTGTLACPVQYCLRAALGRTGTLACPRVLQRYCTGQARVPVLPNKLTHCLRVQRIDILLSRQLDSAQLPAESWVHIRRRNI